MWPRQPVLAPVAHRQHRATVRPCVKPPGVVTLTCIGRGRLNAHAHGWRVVVGGRCREVDLVEVQARAPALGTRQRCPGRGPGSRGDLLLEQWGEWRGYWRWWVTEAQLDFLAGDNDVGDRELDDAAQ